MRLKRETEEKRRSDAERLKVGFSLVEKKDEEEKEDGIKFNEERGFQKRGGSLRKSRRERVKESFLKVKKRIGPKRKVVVEKRKKKTLRSLALLQGHSSSSELGEALC